MVSIKDIRRYIEMALQDDDAIDLHLEMFRFQQKVLQQQMGGASAHDGNGGIQVPVLRDSESPVNHEDSAEHGRIGNPETVPQDSAGPSESGGFLTAAKDGMAAR